MKPEKEFLVWLATRGISFCIEGKMPSRLALVLGGLRRFEVPFVACKITPQTTWDDLCNKLRCPPGPDAEFSAGWEGLSKFLPIKEHTNVNDIAAGVIARDCVIVLDEFHEANVELIKTTAEFCKLLLNMHAFYHEKRFGKFVMVGNPGIFQKMLQADDRLDSRLQNISIERH